MTLEGSAMHDGGSCQISLSFDNGATFRVIKSMIGGCPSTEKYEYTIPSFVPSGKALLAWTWQNHEGDREFYMNCASVTISKSSQSRRRKKQMSLPQSISDLPYIWVANLADVNNCSTTEGVDPVYPDPGSDVEYSAGLSSASPPSPKECEDSTPGPAYNDTEAFTSGAESGVYVSMSSLEPVATFTPSPDQALATGDESMIGMGVTPNDGVASSTPSKAIKITDGEPATTADSAGVFVPLRGNPIGATASASTTVASPSASTSPSSTLTITITNSETITVVTTRHTSVSSTQSSTLLAPVASVTTASLQEYRVAATSTASPAYTSTTAMPLISNSPGSSNCLMSSDFLSTLTLPPSSFATIIPLLGFSSLWRTFIESSSLASPLQGFLTSTASSNAMQASSSAMGAPAPAASSTTASFPSLLPTPPYASGTNGDYTAYLPCVPGTFLCTSNNTFLTCDTAASATTNSHGYMWTAGRAVAAGMACLPNLSPYDSASSMYLSVPLSESGTSAVPRGQYRDDRYVLSEQYGDCGNEGTLQCYGKGNGFYMCDQGGLIDMGAVAPGTNCENGAIIASN
ncbi:MAG: hypothetical protein M1822_008609 [Bathelium mastoideum]|nr:MAG: hypothetical protein M1822_008609 [Bathelium mastoideum]